MRDFATASPAFRHAMTPHAARRHTSPLCSQTEAVASLRAELLFEAGEFAVRTEGGIYCTAHPNIAVHCENSSSKNLPSPVTVKRRLVVTLRLYLTYVKRLSIRGLLLCHQMTRPFVMFNTELFGFTAVRRRNLAIQNRLYAHAQFVRVGLLHN